MATEKKLFSTAIVGSYPQPDWLVDRANLRNRPPPRAKAGDIWRVEARFLDQAQDDAAVLAIRDIESAGIDVVTDGEVRRESYSNRFATALEGMDSTNPATIIGRSGRPVEVPRVVGPVKRNGPVLLKEAEFLRKNTKKTAKVTIPGPFTMTQTAKDEYYRDEASLARDLADAVNQEAKEIKAAGIDVIQLDEPYLQVAPDKARQYAVEAINRAVEGIPGTRVLHTCFGYGYIIKNKPNGFPFLDELNGCKVEQLSLETAQPKLDPAMLERIPEKTIILGALDLGDPTVESAEAVAERLRKALKHVPAEKLMAGPDCGMKYLDRDSAYGKLRALAKGAEILRAEVG